MERKFKLIFGIDISKLTLDVTYSLEGSFRYFQITNDAASMGNNRFRILLGKNNNPVGLEEASVLNNIKIYPNPFKEELYISTDKTTNNNKVEYVIFNQFGQMVHKNTLNFENNTFKINTHELSSGMYFITIKTESFVETKKIIKN